LWKSLSSSQGFLLKKKTNVNNIICIYDFDNLVAVKYTKAHRFELSYWAVARYNGNF
jgi:hypothetical protein